MAVSYTDLLEFDYVFIVGLNQGLIPLRCTGMEQEEEEIDVYKRQLWYSVYCC